MQWILAINNSLGGMSMKKILIYLCLMIVMVALTGCDSAKLREAVDPADITEVLVTVPKGAATKTIGRVLYQSHLISSESAFVNFVKELEVGNKLKAGDYMLSKSMDMETIITKIAKGDVYRNTFKVTIPEGFEVRQIVERLSSEGYGNADAFYEILEKTQFEFEFLEALEVRNNLEGFLFPDTYEFKVGATEKEIITKMLKRFDEVFKKEYYVRAEEMGMSISELITLASIIEREAKLDLERPTVSSVFHNRLNKNHKLESCATIQYILGERKERLLYKDLEVESDFNTYQNVGLPPAPIASPGEASIKAALYPEDTDYMFFVTTDKGDGSHTFSKTLSEHNKAKNSKK